MVPVPQVHGVASKAPVAASPPTIRGLRAGPARTQHLPSRIPHCRRSGGECIHPRRARPFGRSLRSIRCGIFAGYPAFESRFNERIDSGLTP